MTHDEAVATALQLQRDAGLMMTNLQILSQFVTSLNRMSSEVMRLAFGREQYPADAMQAVLPSSRVRRAAHYMTAMGLWRPTDSPGVLMYSISVGLARVASIYHGTVRRECYQMLCDSLHALPGRCQLGYVWSDTGLPVWAQLLLERDGCMHLLASKTCCLIQDTSVWWLCLADSKSAPRGDLLVHGSDRDRTVVEFLRWKPGHIEQQYGESRTHGTAVRWKPGHICEYAI